MFRTERDKTIGWSAAFVLLPVIAVAALYWLEGGLTTFNGGKALDPPTELQKRAFDLDVDLAKTFVTFSLAVLGGIGYYIKARSGEFAPFSKRSAVFTVGVVAASTVSIAGGHIWLAQMRDQFANDTYNFLLTTTPFQTAETVQYISFIVSLIWFALLVIDRETSRPTEGTASAPIPAVTPPPGAART